MSSTPTVTYKLILTTDGEIEVLNTPEMLDFLRRLTACLNACEGISTEELEKGLIQDMQQVIGQVAPLIEDHKNLLESMQKQSRAA